MRHIDSIDGFHRFSSMSTILILGEREVSPREKFRKLRSDAKNADTKRREILARIGGGTARPAVDPIQNQMVAVVPDEALVGICDGLDTGHVMRSHAHHHTELSKPTDKTFA